MSHLIKKCVLNKKHEKSIFADTKGKTLKVNYFYFICFVNIMKGAKMKGNQYRKLHPMDKFAKKFYCQRARLNQIRDDKHYLRTILRRTGKKEIKGEMELI